MGVLAYKESMAAAGRETFYYSTADMNCLPMTHVFEDTIMLHNFLERSTSRGKIGAYE